MKEVKYIYIQIKKPNRFKDFLHKIHHNEETGFNLFQKIPERYMPACIINWMDKYTNKRLNELKQQITHSKWQTMELKKAFDNIHQRQQD